MNSILHTIAIALGGVALLGAILLIVVVMSPPKEHRG